MDVLSKDETSFLRESALRAVMKRQSYATGRKTCHPHVWARQQTEGKLNDKIVMRYLLQNFRDKFNFTLTYEAFILFCSQLEKQKK